MIFVILRFTPWYSQLEYDKIILAYSIANESLGRLLMLLKFDTTQLPNVRFIGFISYKTPWKHFNRTSDEYILYFVNNGSLFIEEENVRHQLKKGSYIILEPGKFHTGYQSSPCDYYYIHFKNPSLLNVDNDIAQQYISQVMTERDAEIMGNCLEYEKLDHPIAYIPKTASIQDSSIINYMLNSAIKDYNLRFEHYRELVGSKVLELFIRLSRNFISSQYQSAGETIEKKYIKAKTLLSFLSNEYCRKITRQDVEDEMEVSYDYLNRIFKEFTGSSIHQHLNKIRVNKAMELIETTQLNFSEIGFLVGIDDQYYFSKLFKKHVGLTPTDYLKSVNR